MRIADDRLERVLQGTDKLLLDGAMGTMLLSYGLSPRDVGDLLCLSDAEAITAIHRAYVEAGSMAVTTNTFNANRDNLGDAATVDEVYAAAIACARASGAAYVAADIGPTGKLLKPYGELSAEDAFGLFAEQARAAQSHGADFVLIETMANGAEMEQAIRAAKSETDLPVFASMTFDKRGRTLMGDTVASACELMERAGADVVGINCSYEPAVLRPLIEDMIAAASKPVLVQANAGMPELTEGEVVYHMDEHAYARDVKPMIDAGATIVGGCCGTTPAYIAELAKLLS